MDIDEQINIEPRFKAQTVPCDGEAGDLLVLTSLGENEPDSSTQGLASLWFCVKSADPKNEKFPDAIWARVQFDGIATCKKPVPKPPQNHPPLQVG